MKGLSDFDIYALFCAKGIGARKLNRLLNSDEIQLDGIEDLISKSTDEIARILPFFSQEDIDSLKNLDLPNIKSEYENLKNSDISLITVKSKVYPPRLSDRLNLDSPPALFCHGNLDIISKDSVAIVGSRDVSDQGLEFARRLVEGMKDRDVSIISGGARGIDSEAHYAAVEHNLDTVVVVAHGINHILKHGVADTVKGNVLFLSQFHPNSGWSAANAMTRNKTICAFSSAVFVVEAAESGGTINTGENALRLGISLYVISPEEFKNPPLGNRYLISRGGREIYMDSASASSK